jgi:uncharacterized PurR-regulated membrane protein YhhQ (DUF165 family)
MKLYLLSFLYVVLLMAGPALSTHVLFGVLPAGMLTGCLLQGVVDVMNNAGGRAFAAHTVDLGMVLRVFVYLAIGLFFPFAFRVFASTTVAAWLVTRLFAIPVFDRLKPRTTFWVRYNLTNLPTQFAVLLLWVPLAYIGTGHAILPILLGGAVWRVLTSVALTPAFAGLARWATVAAILALAIPTCAEDDTLHWKLDSKSRVMASDGPYSYRIEEHFILRIMQFGFDDLMVYDAGGSDKQPWNVNNKITVGIDFLQLKWADMAVVYQYQAQYPQKVPGVNRCGVELRIHFYNE